jgi:hypothetical protein
MEQSSSNSESVIEKSKPGPKAKPKQDLNQLEARIHNLEQLIIRMAHQSGTSHTILIKAGLQPYTPNKEDMTRFKKVS